MSTVGYSLEYLPYLDSDGLMGDRPNPSKWSTGNALLDTGNLYFFLSKLDELTKEDRIRCNDAFNRCKSNGVYNKNPGRPDDISFDDLIGVVAGSKVCDLTHHEELYDYGTKRGFKYSNRVSDNGTYWSSYARPWHIAYYGFSCDSLPNIYLVITLIVYLFVNAFSQDKSGKRLAYLQIEIINTYYPEIESFYEAIVYGLFKLVRWFWYWRLKRTYGSIGRLYTAIYGEHHILSQLAYKAS